MGTGAGICKSGGEGIVDEVVAAGHGSVEGGCVGDVGGCGVRA